MAVDLRPLSGESCERIKRDDALRDVREIGHYGTGNLEIRIESDGDFERTQDLIVASYERS